MNDDHARALVASRIEADPLLENEVGQLVLAAFGGTRAVELLIDQGEISETKEPPASIPVGAYVTSISVEGFRGVGPEATLEIEPGPGLTLVVGRNGSGKSTFAVAHRRQNRQISLGDANEGKAETRAALRPDRITCSATDVARGVAMQRRPGKP